MSATPSPRSPSDSIAIEQQLSRDFDLLHMRDEQLLLNMLVQQNEQIIQRLEGLTERVDLLSAKIDRTEIRAAAEHVNSISRMRNNTLLIPKYLATLHDITTNEPIDMFPETVKGIQTLSTADADRILVALGQIPSGGLAQKKNQILLEAGVTLRLKNPI